MYLSSICAATVSYNKYTAIQIFNNQEKKIILSLPPLPMLKMYNHI